MNVAGGNGTKLHARLRPDLHQHLHTLTELTDLKPYVASATHDITDAACDAAITCGSATRGPHVPRGVSRLSSFTIGDIVLNT